MRKLFVSASILLSSTALSGLFASGAVVVSPEGQQFSVAHVAGNGNCAFDAIGKTRAEVVVALTEAVKEYYDVSRAFDQERSALHDKVAKLSVASSASEIANVSQQVQNFINTSAAFYSTDPNERTPAVLASEALLDFKSKVVGSENEFKEAQRSLQSRIQNMYYERYEAFQLALKEELQESGVKTGNLSTKTGLIKAISEVFSKNSGKSSWLPMGLVMGVNERLGLNLSVWSSRGEPTGKVRLYQTSALSPESPMVHVVWDGGHFDILTPK